MTALHLRKINSPFARPRVVDWICNFNDTTGYCTSCHTIKGKPSMAFLGMHISFIDEWVTAGNINGCEYHQVVENFDEPNKTK